MKTPLDTYDKKPQSMVNYLRYYGLHFNKRLCDFAVSKMKHGKSPIFNAENTEKVPQSSISSLYFGQLR